MSFAASNFYKFLSPAPKELYLPQPFKLLKRMPSKSPKLKINELTLCWVLVLLFIPALSINGRALQHWVNDNLRYDLVALCIFIALVLGLFLKLKLISKKGLKVPFIHVLWMTLLFVGAPLLLPMVEERLHFLVFGAFGVLSMFVYQPKLALVLCLSVSMGDELLQYFLPDRVGDWRDVAMNSLASVAAASFIWMSLIHTQNQKTRDESIS
jgi:hypothetical protein